MAFSAQEARAQLDRLRVVLDGLSLKYVEIEPRMTAVGLAVAFGDAEFSVLSISGGNSSYVYVTAGALKDVSHEKLQILEVCNDYVADRAEVPVYLHDADIGWDVLAQATHPVELYVDVPAYFGLILRAVPNAAIGVRQALGAKGVAGEPYKFSEQDLNRLFITSVF
jgi:hypothetical protein